MEKLRNIVGKKKNKRREIQKFNFFFLMLSCMQLPLLITATDGFGIEAGD